MKPKVDLYEVLGCERSASAENLKKAYKQLALKHHPVTDPMHLLPLAAELGSTDVIYQPCVRSSSGLMN